MKNMKDRTKNKIILSIVIAAALFAAAFFGRIVAGRVLPYIVPPSYSKAADRKIYDRAEDLTVIQKGRKISLYRGEEKIWTLPKSVLAQSVILADIDNDQKKELTVLCWKRGKFGKHRPSWVKYDDPVYSQHIYIYEIEDTAVPKWMASDIGIKARSFRFDDGVLFITDTDGNETGWKWISWGLTKL